MLDRNHGVRFAILSVLVVSFSSFGVSGCGQAPPLAPAESISPTASGLQAGTLASEPDVQIWPGRPPGWRRGRITLDALWPNDDGRFWTYRLREVTLGVPTIRHYSTPDSVPPAPSVAEVARWLNRNRRPTPGISEETGSWDLRFQGRGTTLSGAVGQNLVETLTPDATSPRGLVRRGDGFAIRLARARPDLATALRRRDPTLETALGSSLYPPILLHGYIWEKTADYIGNYGDLDLNLAWKYLEADLRPGHTFTMQLVPALAPDVFLHALVLPPQHALRRRLATPGVEVLYLIDFGVSLDTDASGNPLGYLRTYSYGLVLYVPRVGPAVSVEYHGTQAGQSPGEAIDRVELALVRTGPGADPVSALR